MHLKCRQAGFVTTRQVVYTIMQILDNDGVELRRKGRLKRRKYFAKGPNYLWHLDAYDKLKPYGLCISGCIDGFSRQLIWLNVYRTSSNPRHRRTGQHPFGGADRVLPEWIQWGGGVVAYIFRDLYSVGGGG